MFRYGKQLMDIICECSHAVDQVIKSYLDCGRGYPVEESADPPLLELGVGYVNPAGKVPEQTQNHSPSQEVGASQFGHQSHDSLNETELRCQYLKCRQVSNVFTGFL